MITFPDRPNMLIGDAGGPVDFAGGECSAAVPPAGLAAVQSHADRGGVSVAILQSGLALARVFRDDPRGGCDPGIGRVVLILLVPAALGLACLVEFLDRRRWAIASWIVVLVCLAEQGVTTATFDAAANRASIEDLASRIDRSRVAFYYHPDDGQPFSIHHLDAMWASLATGVPTVNGYSGHVPRRWQRLLPGRLRSQYWT